ncbi:hypothetical protein BCR41DRAFT_346124 [Lobosporangium transversale]|uniref:Pacifastin domain-containing protein n=1 Tax=Lobosporangium transversale TaxID=64571 RepID=A0A1Y2H482_9FUNG|nr:hypothetical protein BCR41DRAFT_346124 [Lobosporangium transversale]ORZ27862.1 hypothetical protein BCR41DRAFT_346124 [Lobosporangium transversale]|eukprot:XP_021885565.1 hypothetical protein BCR41DRAFT_346124 [Lobosporangium transversale]
MKPCVVLCTMLVASLAAAYPDYSYKRCIKAYGTSSFACDDLCNTCACAPDGLVSTDQACPPYDFKKCKKVKGIGAWPCNAGNNMCRCAPRGVKILVL